ADGSVGVDPAAAAEEGVGIVSDDRAVGHPEVRVPVERGVGADAATEILRRVALEGAALDAAPETLDMQTAAAVPCEAVLDHAVGDHGLGVQQPDPTSGLAAPVADREPLEAP